MGHRSRKLFAVTGLVAGCAVILYVLFLARSSPPAGGMVGRASVELPYLDSNLPIVVIDTSGQTIRNQPRIIAHLGIIHNRGGRNSTTESFNEYDGRISIEIRGTSSQQFPKKSFALETQDEQGNNLNVPLLGMPRENDWILYAPYSDKSLMRNVLTFKLAREMGRYAPRTRFCELVLVDKDHPNGEYQGVYVLMEKIKADPNRVDVARLRPGDTEGDALTGGYVIQLDWGDERAGWVSRIPSKPWGEQHFYYHHPQHADLAPVQRAYIRELFGGFENALAEPDYRDAQAGYRSHVDLDSFVDYFVGVELARNCDGYRISTYLHKDRDSRGGKLAMGPLWDFNLAYGNQEEGGFGSPIGWVYEWESGLDPIVFWWDRLLADPEFERRLRSRWAELRKDQLRTERILAEVDSMALYLGEAQERNFERWPILGEHVWPNAFVGETYQQEVEYLKRWLGERLAWMDANIQDGTFVREESEATVPLAGEDETPTVASGRGKWAPMSKCLYWYNDALLFDVGWVGYTVAGGAQIRDGGWHHVALAGPSPLEFYVDGALSETDQLDGIEADNATDAFQVGACAVDFPEEPASPSFVGALDEVRVYDRRLSAAQVREIYESADLVDEGALALWWQFDSPAVEEDSSDNGRTATVNGAAVAAGRFGEGLYFDGGDSVALNSGFVDFGSQDYTFMVWISTTGTSGPIFSVARSGE